MNDIKKEILKVLAFTSNIFNVGPELFMGNFNWTLFEKTIDCKA